MKLSQRMVKNHILNFETRYEQYFGKYGIDVESLLSIYPKTQTLKFISCYLRSCGETESIIDILLTKYFNEEIRSDDL